MNRRPSEIELLASLMGPPTPEYLSEPIKAVFREESRKNLLQAQVELPLAIRNCGLFYFRNVATDRMMNPGVRGIVTLKEYPNIWAEFCYTADCIKDLEFTCYVGEDKWQKFSIPFTIFKWAIGWQSRHETNGLLGKLFGKKELNCKSSRENIQKLVTWSIEKVGENLVPNKFFVGKGISDINWDLQQAREYSKTRECIWYELDDTGEIISTNLKFDNTQWMLLQVFKEPNKDI